MKGKSVLAKAVSILMATTMMASMLTGCSKGGENGETSSTDTAKSEYTYVADYQDIDLGFDGENGYVDSYKIKKGYLYYLYNEYSEEQSISKLMKISLADGSKSELPLELGTEEGVSTYDVAEDGSYVALVYSYSEEGSSKYLFESYDSNGQQICKNEIAELANSDVYISNMYVNNDGLVVIPSEEAAIVYDQSGNKKNEIEYGSSVNWTYITCLGEDGNLYMCYSSNDNGNYSCKVGKLDLASGKLEEVTGGLNITDASAMTSIGDGKFLLSSSDSLYLINANDGSSEKALDWLTCDINGRFVTSVCPADEDNFYALVDDWENSMTDLVKVNKVKSSEVAEKKEIVLGTLYSDSSVTSAVIKFNKNNPEYHVSIKTYFDTSNTTDTAYADAITAMNNDILTDDCPDIIDLSSLHIPALAQKGLLEDLGTYLDTSDKIRKDDLLDSVINGYSYDGKLVGIPNRIYINTLIGSVSDVGTAENWTVSEMLDVAKANPDKAVMDYATKGSMLQVLISYDQDSFIDWEKGTCNFDNQDFIDVLEFCNTLPDDDDDSVWDDDDSTPVKIKKGKVLLAPVSLAEPESIQEYQSYFTGESNFIGFPSNGGSGAYMDAFCLYGITSKSDVKEEAWAFIESSLTNVDDNGYYYGVSPLKSEIEKQIAKSQEVSYATDENGEYILDENGEKITEGTSSISYGDWDYTYHPVTDEEAEIFRNIINNAEPSQTSDQTVLDIIQEEAGAYFSGQKSPEDVAGIIQSRINIYINESR